MSAISMVMPVNVSFPDDRSRAPDGEDGKHDARFLRAVLDSSGDCIKVLDLDGNLVFMNSGGQRVMEVDDLGAVLGCPWTGFWKGPTRARAEDALERARAGKVSEFQGACNTMKGKPRFWEVKVRPILNRNGGPWRILVISRDITELHDKQEHERLLTDEAHHRMRNLMAAVLAITAQSFRNAQSITDARSAIESRLVALGSANELLMSASWQGADLRAVIESAIRAHDDPRQSRFDVAGESCQLSARAAMALTLTLNELATNAVKYGALSNAEGRIRIETGTDGANQRFRLNWREEGGPPVRPPARRGFGSRLIQVNVEGQLDGTVRMDYAASGFYCVIDVPLASLSDGR